MSKDSDALGRYLDRGEKLLWAGRPVQGIVFSAIDWYLIPFSVLWLGLVLGMFGSRSQAQSNAMDGLTGLFFIAVGVYMLIGRYVFDWFNRSAMFYGVTDRRAIVLSGMYRRSVHSIDFVSLSGLKLDERADGSGTISFGDQPIGYSQQWAAWGGRSANQFFRVSDVKRVYEIIREAMRRLKSKD